MFEWNLGILALQNTENGLLNAEFVDFSLFAGLFYGSLRSFFAWLGFLCVELAFCGTAFVRLTARLWLAFLGFLTAFSLNKKATAWLLLSALKATR